VFIHFIRRFSLVAALMVAIVLPVWAQRQSATPPAPPGDRNGLGTAPADEDDASARLAHDMAKKANIERQAAIKSDTEKLLKLAVELKADVVKKAEEIERLAHSVKDKMKGPN
jgi:hypothetical protein